MSLRLDPRRLSALKSLAGDAGMRPGDLVRQWVEERIDAERRGGSSAQPGDGLRARVDELAARVAALEASLLATDGEERTPTGAAAPEPMSAEPDDEVMPAEAAPDGAGEVAPDAPADEIPDAGAEVEAPAKRAASRRRKAVSAAPTERVALHDEMIAVINERGPLSAGELADAITERGRYRPPRSGKPLDAAMVSQRASNPTYRGRFRRADGRIGLAD